MPTNTAIFHPANQAIIDDIKKELRLQGHYLTGALEASLLPKEINENGGVSLIASALAYLDDLEHFTPAGQVKLDESEFQKLKKWVKLRGMASSDFEAGQIASAIYSKWKKEGKGTEAAKAYSSTGQRTDAVKTSFETNQPKYTALLDKAAIGSLDNSFLKIKSGTL